MAGTPTPLQSTNLFLLEDLEDADRTGGFAPGDLDALRTVAGWIRAFIVKANDELGRAGPVCPFMPAAIEHNTVWLVPEHAGDGSVSDVAVRVRDYERILAAQPTDAEDGSYKAVVIVFTDLPLDRAGAFFDDVLGEVAVQSYVEDGLAMGGSFKGSEAGAIYNPSFKPFTSPVPFLLSREAVVSDWKFFIDDDAWLERWAQRFGESGAEALARELRPLPWRAGGESRSRSEEQIHLGGAFETISSYERRSS